MPVIDPPSPTRPQAAGHVRLEASSPDPALGDPPRDAAANPGGARLGLPRADQILTIVRTTASIMGSTIATSVLGFAYWWAAARVFDPVEVGLSSAAVSAMLLLAKLGTMGIGTALAGTLPRHDGAPGRLLMTGILAAAAIGAALGAVFALLAPVLSPNLAPLASTPLVVLLFALGVALSSVASVFDQGVIGLLRGGVQLYRNVVFASSKLAAVVVAGLVVPELRLVILATWVLGEVVSLGGLIFLRRSGVEMLPRRADWSTLANLASHTVAHHALGVARYAPTLAMPVFVAAMLSTEANASFYVMLLVAGIVQLVSSASTFTLYAVARHRPEDVPRQVRLTLLLSFGGLVPAIATLVVLGEPVLSVFGPRYAADAQPTLTLLALTAIPLVIRDHWIALQRIHERLARAAVITSVVAVIEVVAALLGAQVAGVPGLAVGWLIGLAVPSVFQIPAVVDAARSGTRDTRPAPVA